MMKRDERNLSMLTDFYELTMMNGYLEKGMGDTVAVFDVFFRTIPDNGGFAIFAGLEQLIDYLKNLSFTEDDIDYPCVVVAYCFDLVKVNNLFIERF